MNVRLGVIEVSRRRWRGATEGGSGSGGGSDLQPARDERHPAAHGPVGGRLDAEAVVDDRLDAEAVVDDR